MQRLWQGKVLSLIAVRMSMHAGAPPAPVKSGSKAPAPLPEAVKEQEAEREARETEALQRELARAEAALAALRTEHEDLVAVRAQLKRSVHRLEVHRPGVQLTSVPPPCKPWPSRRPRRPRRGWECACSFCISCLA